MKGSSGKIAGGAFLRGYEKFQVFLDKSKKIMIGFGNKMLSFLYKT